MDPTVYCVLTARSKVPGELRQLLSPIRSGADSLLVDPDVSISDLLVFTAKWTVTKDTFRPPVS